MLDDELLRFWKALNDNNVRYTNMKGLENIAFSECLNMASIADLEGVRVPFLHINHLIENKRIVSRPKDQIDVIELEKIRKIREEEG